MTDILVRCKWCKKEIQKGAKVCANCQCSQNPIFYYLKNLGLLLPILMLIIAIGQYSLTSAQVEQAKSEAVNAKAAVEKANEALGSVESVAGQVNTVAQQVAEAKSKAISASLSARAAATKSENAITSAALAVEDANESKETADQALSEILLAKNIVDDVVEDSEDISIRVNTAFNAIQRTRNEQIRIEIDSMVSQIQNLNATSGRIQDGIFATKASIGVANAHPTDLLPEPYKTNIKVMEGNKRDIGIRIAELKERKAALQNAL